MAYIGVALFDRVGLACIQPRRVARIAVHEIRIGREAVTLVGPPLWGAIHERL